MPAAAVPALIGAGSSIGSGLLSYFGAKKASKPNPLETQAQQTQTGAATQLAGQGKALSDFGMPKLQQAGNYFSTLAGGNRAATAQTLAPEAQNINDTYTGAGTTISRFLRGPERDFQTAELARGRAGAIGSLFTGARDRGVSGLTNLGMYGTNAGVQASEGAAAISGNVADRSMSNRFGGAGLQRQAGADTAGLIFQLLKSGMFSRGTGGASTGGSPTVEPYSGGASSFGGFG